jgi:acetyl esterase
MREKAIREMTELQRMTAQYVNIRTVADVRHVETSKGLIRVLEYGFGSPGVRPLLVDLHGGGYCLLAPEYDEHINLRIVGETGIRVISIDYPKAPQNPYPAGIEATYEVIRHYHDNAAKYGIDRNRIGIGGYSSGGNFATVACIMANEKKDIGFKYQMLCYPSTNPSKGAHDKPKGDEKYLPNDRIESFILCYLTDPELAKLPYVSPVLASDGQLRGLPPALMIVAGHSDPLRPDGLQYAERLRTLGVPVDVHEFSGPHGFIGEPTPDAVKAQDLMISFIKRHI